MIDKVQKIREEVERIQLYTQSEVLKKVLDYMDEVQKEPVSEELEEAAITAADEDMQGRQIMEESNENRQLYSRIFRRGFKDGAKWKKEQLMAKAIDAVISQVPCSNEIILYNPASVHFSYLPQEMNKLGVNKGDKVKVIVIKED